MDASNPESGMNPGAFSAESATNPGTFSAESVAALLNQLSAQLGRNNGTSNPSIDQTSPYYIHPSENPGIPIIPIIMNGSNYGDWSRALTLALQSKNKFDFVDGTIKKPLESDPLFRQWKRCNTYVIGWINLSLSPDISQSVMWNNLAYEIWSELRRRYYHGDRFRIAELKEELYAAKQGELSITAYFMKLRSL
ncbi:uncharacterized protein LOC107615125 [Arachis ipaensis]|uniref:uncharacterized protein LOC107615125 n=1 Tax=Arachis ipaensis TaxID=130454 RepID=UPI0007AFC5F3|nr:uncharacterized protein LOC107615125 [Arachis ipaensis]XP_025678149.1 uncharacterized protein LOC112777992 [Arachis hypogaea]